VIPVIAREPLAETEPEYRELEKYESGAADEDARKIDGPHGEPWLNVLDRCEPASPPAVEFALAHPAIRPLIKGHAIDLGAGTCWLTARLSTLFDVSEVVALDMSERFLTQVGSRVIEKRGGRPEKVRFAVGSFNKIPFPATSFDCAFLVAAIHHSLSPLKTLIEARRVLVPDGALLLVESPSSVLRVRANRRRAIDISRSSGATEICYTTGELEYLLRHAGFDRVTFYPVDVLTRGVRRRGLRRLLRAVRLEDLVKPPVYVIVAQ
jgi:SAM-dependent methyltransferase